VSEGNTEEDEMHSEWTHQAYGPIKTTSQRVTELQDDRLYVCQLKELSEDARRRIVDNITAEIDRVMGR
jgi:hypothetical protein